jgi:hypothetical protein
VPHLSGPPRVDLHVIRAGRCIKNTDCAEEAEGVPQGFDSRVSDRADRAQLHPEGLSCRLDDSELANPGASRGITDDRHSCDVGRDLLEQLEPFCAQAVFDGDFGGGASTDRGENSSPSETEGRIREPIGICESILNLVVIKSLTFSRQFERRESEVR